MHKIEKQAALYIFRPETSITCKSCVFLKDFNKCVLFNDKVELYGTCGFYIHGEVKDANPKMPWISGVTKLEAGYLENKVGFQCVRCEEFLCGQRDCKKVDKDSAGDNPGEIHPFGCCNMWEKDKERGNFTREQAEEYIATNTKGNETTK